MRALLMGPPGAGKGTQAGRLADALDVPAISTGDIFRANVFGGTALGREAKSFMDAGNYVPDRITNEMVRDRLSQGDARHGWLLDGYPRTALQVEELDRLCKNCGSTLGLVLVLGVLERELVDRLVQRAAVEGRADDTEDVIRRRQQVYREQTEPLMAAYQARGLLSVIDGRSHVDEVARRCLEAVSAARGASASTDRSGNGLA